MPNGQADKPVTQEDVANRAGVSRSIVSYVINKGPRNVSDATRDRVLDAIRELGYRPNKHAQMLSSASDSVATRHIGIILASDYMFKRPYYGHILAAMHQHAHEHDLHIRFIRVLNDFNDPTLFNELIHPNEISNVILLGLDQVLAASDAAPLIEQIVSRVDHVVTVEWEWPGVPAVQFDRQNAAYQAASHLIDIGRRQIAYIGPQDRRVQGFQQANWEQGLRPDERLLRYAIDPEWGFNYCEQLINAGLAFDAVCVGSDEVAVGVLNCLSTHDYRIPQDVAVASIDNLDIAAYTIPSLTTVDVPKNEIGQQAINALVSQQIGTDASAISITLRTQLIVRQSSVVKP